MSELDRISEEVLKRARTGVGQPSVVSGTVGQPGNTNTSAGGSQKINTSSNIGNNSELIDIHGTIAIKDDPKSNISSDKSEQVLELGVGRKEAFLGNASDSVMGSENFGGPESTR